MPHARTDIWLMIAPFLLSFLGCGGDGSLSSFSEPAEVTDLKVSARTITVGEVAKVEVSFSPARFTPGDTSVDDDSPSSSSAKFELIVSLPPGLDYIDGSSELTDSFLADVVFGNADDRGPNEVGICEDGSRFLLYRFSDDELSVDSPLSTVIEFRVRAFESAGRGEVGAATDSSISSPCTERLEIVVGVEVGV